MEYPEFLQIVRTEADLDESAAERAARATLTTLTERLSRGRARDLLQQLPAPIKPWLNTDRNAERSDVDEFLRRVAPSAREWTSRRPNGTPVSSSSRSGGR